MLVLENCNLVHQFNFFLQKWAKLLSKLYSGFLLLTWSNILTAVLSLYEHREWFKSVPNDIKNVNIFENLPTKIFRGFRVFKYPLWRNTKTRKCWKSTESLLNKKTPIVNSYRYYKTAKKQQSYYLSTIFTLITSKTSFKLQW